jgi:hypothetical protein
VKGACSDDCATEGETGTQWVNLHVQYTWKNNKALPEKYESILQEYSNTWIRVGNI